jgi:hypothetical protein
VRWHDIAFGVRRHIAAFLDATCRVGPKRGHVRALQSRMPPGQRGAGRGARGWAMTEIKLGRTPHSLPRRSNSPRRNAVKTGAKTGAFRT